MLSLKEIGDIFLWNIMTTNHMQSISRFHLWGLETNRAMIMAISVTAVFAPVGDFITSTKYDRHVLVSNFSFVMKIYIMQIHSTFSCSVKCPCTQYAPTRYTLSFWHIWLQWESTYTFVGCWFLFATSSLPGSIVIMLTFSTFATVLLSSPEIFYRYLFLFVTSVNNFILIIIRQF